jgi:predicted transcriptional regulator
MIRDVYDALASNVTAPEPAPDPAVPIKKSITPNYLVCLEDGKKLKMLKRHLKTAYDMSPEDYRAKWGLNSDYPMVAPAYLCQAAQRTGQGHRSGSNQAQGEAGGQAQGQAPGRQEVTPSGPRRRRRATPGDP